MEALFPETYNLGAMGAETYDYGLEIYDWETYYLETMLPETYAPVQVDETRDYKLMVESHLREDDEDEESLSSSPAPLVVDVKCKRYLNSPTRFLSHSATFKLERGDGDLAAEMFKWLDRKDGKVPDLAQRRASWMMANCYGGPASLFIAKLTLTLELGSTTKPEVLLAERVKITGMETETGCAICWEVFQVGDQAARMPCRRHIFHRHCISRWLVSHRVCPLCPFQLHKHCLKDIYL